MTHDPDTSMQSLLLQDQLLSGLIEYLAKWADWIDRRGILNEHNDSAMAAWIQYTSLVQSLRYFRLPQDLPVLFLVVRSGVELSATLKAVTSKSDIARFYKSYRDDSLRRYVKYLERSVHASQAPRLQQRHPDLFPNNTSHAKASNHHWYDKVQNPQNRGQGTSRLLSDWATPNQQRMYRLMSLFIHGTYPAAQVLKNAGRDGTSIRHLSYYRGATLKDYMDRTREFLEMICGGIYTLDMKEHQNDFEKVFSFSRSLRGLED